MQSKCDIILWLIFGFSLGRTAKANQIKFIVFGALRTSFFVTVITCYKCINSRSDHIIEDMNKGSPTC